MVLLMSTSGASSGNILELLSKAISTVAAEAGFLSLPPLKIKLDAFSARIDFADNRPRTKQSASPTFDFPEPLGPRMTLNLLSNGISVLWAKLLNPWIAIRFILVISLAHSPLIYNCQVLVLVYKGFPRPSYRLEWDDGVLKF